MPITDPSPQGRLAKESVWRLPSAFAAEELLAELKLSFDTSQGERDRSVITWFDTFDWRLYSRGQLLYYDRVAWHLVHRDSGEEIAVIPDHGGGGWRFCRNFPVSRLRTLLEPLLAHRILLQLFRSTVTTVSLSLLDREDKTVARLVAETHCPAGADREIHALRLRGVRGYDDDFERIRSFLNERGIREEVGPCFFFDEGVQSGGRTPLDYSARFRPALWETMTAREALIMIYRDLLAAMQANEQGMIDDLDTEFLHDFRVAVRRTRSGLGQIRKVLPAEPTNTFRREFAWLGEITGPTRDLDVYLLEEAGYLARLPEELRPALASYFAELRSRRLAERKRLVRRLRSARYRKLIADWQEFLTEGGGGEPSKKSGMPVLELAGKIITRRFTEMVRAGEKITPASPEEKYHQLRIQGKKLRYILEFFSALFPEKEGETAIKALKRLQDNLGMFNDLTVQQNALREHLVSLSPGSRRNLRLAAAIGGLLTSLGDEQVRVREEFSAQFAEFSLPANAVLYRKYCQGKG